MSTSFQLATVHLTCGTPFWIALALVAVIAIIARARQIDLPRLSKLLALLGLFSLALAVASPVWMRSHEPRIVVMVDVSPSTRGASWYDESWLRQRIGQLVGNLKYEVERFGVDANATHFAPPAADAIVLFSDGQFDLPASAPPTFSVVDPALETASDAAIQQLSCDGRDVAITVRNQTPTKPRRLTVTGVRASSELPIDESLATGTLIFHAQRDDSGAPIVARITGDDRWPENDELRIALPGDSPTPVRWWVHRGESNRAPASWRSISASEFPTDPAELLSPAVIVLDDVAADDLSPAAMQEIYQYVHELGGSVILVGGEHSFGAGDYFDTTLDAMSPLASDPPAPSRQWFILLDSSGSMASRWSTAVTAMFQTAHRLPPTDPLSIASFSDHVRWWSVGKSIDESLEAVEGIETLSPRGPTNLQSALESLTTKVDGSLPADVLIISDADAKLDDPAALARRLNESHIRLHLLATGTAAPAPISELVAQTHGQLLQESDATKWSLQLRKLLRTAKTEAIHRGTTSLTLESISRKVDFYNAVWPRKDAVIIGTVPAAPIAATWNFGLGKVTSLAFVATQDEIDRLAQRFETSPRDPRFSVLWEFGDNMHVRVDAVDHGKYLNDLPITLSLLEGSLGQRTNLLQTGPGRYELTLAAPTVSQIATINNGTSVLARAVMSTSYAPEFRAVGNDRDMMRALADRTGGAVIEPMQTTPIAFSRSTSPVALAPALSLVGCVLLALALIHWRRSVM